MGNIVGQWDSGTVDVGRRQTVRRQTSDIEDSQMQEGGGAFCARVLSFVRFAPNDGFSPQSGLVQRRVIKPTPWRQCKRLWRYFIMRPQGATTL